MCSSSWGSTAGEALAGGAAAGGWAAGGVYETDAGEGIAGADVTCVITGADNGSAPRLILTLTSPRSNSNSAMSFSIRNSISSFSSFWFMVWGGPASYSLVPAWEPACRTNSLRRSSLNLYKFLLLGRKYFAPGFCYYHHVFNANTPLSWN